MRKICILSIILCTCIIAKSQWSYNPNVNTPVYVNPADFSKDPKITDDGNGGYFVTWPALHPSVYGYEIYAQHFNAYGERLWAQNGIVICNAQNSQLGVEVLGDGSGGAFFVWHDERSAIGNYDIYAQRVNSSGVVQWTANGIQITSGTFAEFAPQLVSDNSGGIVLTYYVVMNPGFTDTDIYAQRLNGSGVKQWPGTNGVVVCNAAAFQNIPLIVSDGSGGGIITWSDNRSGTYDIYSQRINSAGSSVWAANGILVSAAAGEQSAFSMISDENDGAIIAWHDFRSGPTGDIYVQRLDVTGTALWTTDGAAVCTAANSQTNPDITLDGTGGVIIAWHDQRVNSAIYAQHMNASGVAQWPANGVPVCTVLNNYGSPRIIYDGNNGAIIAWEDKRSADKNIYAQHLSPTGAPLWTLNGTAICTAANDQHYHQVGVWYAPIVSNNHGGAVIVWSDERNGVGDVDIFITQVSDAPAEDPLIIDVKDICVNAPTTRGKLLNPPVVGSSSITITLDGNPIAYQRSDSSFQFFTNGVTALGPHTVSVKYTNFNGFTQKDSVFNVLSPLVPTLSISGNTTVTQGSSTLLLSNPTNAGSTPVYQWQDSTNMHTWQDIPSANASTLNYTPALTGDKVRLIMTSSLICVNPATITSNALSFIVNVPTGLDPTPSQFGLKLYPNPVENIWTIDSLKLSDKWISLDVYSITGYRILESISLKNKTRVQVDLGSLPGGIYMVVLRRSNADPVSVKIIKQ